MKKAEKKYKTFNTSGLCFPHKHYMVDPLKRLTEVETLIQEELYFTRGKWCQVIYFSSFSTVGANKIPDPIILRPS